MIETDRQTETNRQRQPETAREPETERARDKAGQTARQIETETEIETERNRQRKTVTERVRERGVRERERGVREREREKQQQQCVRYSMAEPLDWETKSWTALNINEFTLFDMFGSRLRRVDMLSKSAGSLITLLVPTPIKRGRCRM